MQSSALSVFWHLTCRAGLGSCAVVAHVLRNGRRRERRARLPERGGGVGCAELHVRAEVHAVGVCCGGGHRIPVMQETRCQFEITEVLLKWAAFARRYPVAIPHANREREQAFTGRNAEN